MMQFLTRNWWLKLISLLLAIGLWFYAEGEESIEISRQIPLEVKVENEKMSILKKSTDEIQVFFQVPRALLSDLTSKQITAFHEVEKEIKTTGDYSFRVEARDIRVPTPQIRVVRIQPEVVVVTLDEMIVKKLPVEPNFSGEPAFGYQIHKEKIQLNPNAVLVEGPKGELEKMDSIKTEKIDLVGRIRSFRRTLEVVLPPHMKATSESLIDTVVPVHEEYIEKTFQKVPVQILRRFESDPDILIDPKEVDLTLEGSKKALESIYPEQTLAYVESSAVKEGGEEIPVKVILPEGVQIKNGLAPKVKVTLRKK